MYQYALQGIPLVLALVAIMACAFRFNSDARFVVRVQMILHIVAALLLVVAQSSWWKSYLIDGNLLGTIFANYVWTAFNGLVMGSVIYSAVSHHD